MSMAGPVKSGLLATWRRYWLALAAAFQLKVGVVSAVPALFAGAISTGMAGPVLSMVMTHAALHFPSTLVEVRARTRQ